MGWTKNRIPFQKAVSQACATQASAMIIDEVHYKSHACNRVKKQKIFIPVRGGTT